MLKQRIMRAFIGPVLLFLLLFGGAPGPAAPQVHTTAAQTASVHPYGWCAPPLPPC